MQPINNSIHYNTARLSLVVPRLLLEQTVLHSTFVKGGAHMHSEAAFVPDKST